MARPRIDIDWAQLDKLCAYHCSLTEIADFFGCSIDTIERAVKRKAKVSFADYRDKKASLGKIRLRRRQFQLAMKGDRAMLVWLGKQWLKQSEHGEPVASARPAVMSEPPQLTFSLMGAEGVDPTAVLRDAFLTFFDKPMRQDVSDVSVEPGDSGGEESANY